ncbi:MAG TPA: hypothetical protein PKD24_14880 [Pyrinomonadaceae bacterium]|nr:hypothetical protein [Pyrinomonadaceae bacterium]HMP66668.1 hypothetical protein [Pyrinomonadaceae bacterium]
MEDQTLQEIWQVEAAGKIYEAPFAELPVWIAEGSLLPDDKVRKGDLRWIEAKRVPKLVPFFNAKASGQPMPLIVSEPEPAPAAETSEPKAELSGTTVSTAHLNVSGPAIAETPLAIKTKRTPTAEVGSPDNCRRHTDAPASYACDSCGGVFCKACPSSYGGSVKICPECGQLCKPLGDQSGKAEKKRSAVAFIDRPFGFSDLGDAFAHPFRFRASLVFGSILFMVFTLGQSAASLGSFFLAGAALMCVMLANMLSFGVLANTVNNFSQGELESDFMPSFEDFSLWEDMLHPFFLSIGVYLTSFGPLMLTVAIGTYLVFSSVSSHIETIESDLQRIPGTPYYASNRAVEQSEEIKELLAAHSQKIKEQSLAAENGSPMPMVDDETREQELLWEKVQESRREQLEATFGSTEEAQEQAAAAIVSSILRLAAPLVVIGGIALLWGLFFFPAACLVAGYTRSFLATMNPLVGLDTIRRLGLDYIKLLMMAFVLVIASIFVGAVLAVIFSPFDMPRLGNIPAKAFGAVFWFYLTIVFSCLLGYLLFRSSSKLRLPR